MTCSPHRDKCPCKSSIILTGVMGPHAWNLRIAHQSLEHVCTWAGVGRILRGWAGLWQELLGQKPKAGVLPSWGVTDSNTDGYWLETENMGTWSNKGAEESPKSGLARDTQKRQLRPQRNLEVFHCHEPLDGRGRGDCLALYLK